MGTRTRLQHCEARGRTGGAAVRCPALVIVLLLAGVVFTPGAAAETRLEGDPLPSNPSSQPGPDSEDRSGLLDQPDEVDRRLGRSAACG